MENKLNKNELTESQLWKLRNEIVLCSLYYNDYENSFNLTTHSVCDFFDGYSDYLEELMVEDGFTDDDYFDQLGKYDTSSHLYEWYCCYNESPFEIEKNDDDDF